MATTAKTLRRIGADAPRPEWTLTDRLIERIQHAADNVARWAWVRSYERAEAVYWPEGEHNK
jgi:hypothetical protein